MSIHNKLSPTAKIINYVVALPLITVALYLLWSGHESMFWVNELRDSILSDSASQRRSDKMSFVIALLAVGVPALIPSIMHDFVRKQGMFSKASAS